MEIIRNKVSHSFNCYFILYSQPYILGKDGSKLSVFSFFAESFKVEKGSCNIQLLLCKKDCCPHCDLPILLRGITCNRFST